MLHEPARLPHEQPRSVGQLVITAKYAEGRSRLDELRQQGSFRALFPHGARGDVLAIMLNTSGGVTGGDRFDTEAVAGAGAALTLSTQAAERAYRIAGDRPGSITTRLRAEAGATLHWLPQETILFDGAGLDRDLHIDMHPSARVVLCEPLILGRRAMGERVTSAHLTDRWQVHRGGELIFLDTLRLRGPVQDLADRIGIADGATAMAQVMLAAPDADAELLRIRTLLPPTAGASLVRDGVLFIRILAEDGYALRRSLVPILEVLTRAPLPRTWSL
ncbi:urease accessory protein UreD [Ketogulonicigenium vulgare]|uniref:Urease accessory protein UreD n=1 Tax=Ketogulonicigenium vulgare (strain WSH-001) TaxID=759362 RepID=F9Y9Y9_KETVW|nr:urease accessory protein UreD [Ketogulonicigenium vulgare]AEM40241.1 Urease accessory protein UreD [Ketogulonicigenium vulgare WSH-001]ALJ80442.1 urease accessory protein ureD [Ketogulonicigenium vulgare]ANW33269.1 urease accessory protein ureD [Ketogulonicigenium vulgare]AOZ53948.1 Urease accessory protein UreD [Ketogulonicigenium vulgare]